VVRSRDSSAHTLCGSNRPVLIESTRAQNTRLIRPHIQINVIRPAIAIHRPLVRAARTRIIRPITLDDIVLHKRILEPAIYGEIPISIRGEGAGVGDDLGGARVPAFAGDEVAVVAAPVYAVGAAGAERHGDGAGVLPEGVVITIISAD